MKKRQTHYKERGQPKERERLGALEKNRHFLIRSKQHKETEEKIQKIKKLAAESNPNEFQFFMHKYRRQGTRLVPLEEKSAPKDLPSPSHQRPSTTQSLPFPQKIVFADD
ncbi:U3 small nucleolar RNA-associated protein 11 [Nematocida displodere]|uniref:U3 small nucleolar RNA-associated protein 11 n=1 Tax=Nematocida displodere TaxID=1805483 RepID=A0A177EEZ2_9MICR|nr:U3 small nucleolar RNA-associated protein 11 [Nematocida displodere]